MADTRTLLTRPTAGGREAPVTQGQRRSPNDPEQPIENSGQSHRHADQPNGQYRAV